MKAIVWTEYGPPEVLQLKEVEKPTPKDNEVRIKIRATTVTTGDCEQRSLNLPIWHAPPLRLYVGLKSPKMIGVPGMVRGDRFSRQRCEAIRGRWSSLRGYSLCSNGCLR